MERLVINLEEMGNVVHELTAAGEVHAPGEVSITVEGIDSLDVAPEVLRLAGVAAEFGIVVNNLDSVRLLDRAHTLLADTRQHLVPAARGDPSNEGRHQRLLACANALRELAKGVGSGDGSGDGTRVQEYMQNFITRVENACDRFLYEVMSAAEFSDELQNADIILSLWAENEYIYM